MKKIFTIIIATIFTLLPSYGSCDITGGACSVFNQTTLKDKYAPNHLQELKKPDAFAPQYKKPYYDMLLNTEEETPQNSQPQSQSYNSNCQFGVCLPGETINPEFPMD